MGANRSILRVRSPRLKFPQTFDLARNDQVFVAAKRDAMLGREALSPFGDKVHMRAVAQNFARRADRIGDALDTAHAAGAQSGAVHDERIELHLAVAIEKAAATRVEGLVVFHDDHSFLDRIERRSTAFEHPPARSHGVAHTVEMSFHHVIRNGPGAAMNDQNRIVQGKSSGETEMLGRTSASLEIRSGLGGRGSSCSCPATSRSNRNKSKASDRSVRPTRHLRGLPGLVRQCVRAFGPGVGVADAMDHGDRGQHGDHPKHRRHHIEQGSDDH